MFNKKPVLFTFDLDHMQQEYLSRLGTCAEQDIFC